VAANWSLGTQLKAPQPDHSLTFFGAKIAATFMQLNAELHVRFHTTDGTNAKQRNDCVTVILPP
jgi:hypothetical protein